MVTAAQIIEIKSNQEQEKIKQKKFYLIKIQISPILRRKLYQPLSVSYYFGVPGSNGSRRQNI